MPRRRRASTPGRIAAAIVNARNRSARRIRSSHSANAPTTTATTTEAATNARRAVSCTAGLFPMLALQETWAWPRSRGRDRRPRRGGLPGGAAARDRAGTAARLGDPARRGRRRAHDRAVAGLGGRGRARRVRGPDRVARRLEVGADTGRRDDREGLRRRRDLAAPGARRPARGRRGGRARADARGPAPRVRDGRRRPARPRPRPSAEAGLPPRRTPRRLSRGPPGHGECLTLAAARGSVSKADRKLPATGRRADPRVRWRAWRGSSARPLRTGTF